MVALLTRQSTGALLYVLGFFTAGLMMIMAGDELNKSSTSLQSVHDLFWVSAIFLLFAGIGIVIEKEKVICGSGAENDAMSFVGLLEMLGIFGMSTGGMGLAIYYSDEKNSTTEESAASAHERESLAQFTGVASIVFLISCLLLTLAQQKWCSQQFILGCTTSVVCIALSVFWFLFANDQTSGADNDDLSVHCYVIGILFVVIGFAGCCKCFGHRSV